MQLVALMNYFVVRFVNYYKQAELTRETCSGHPVHYYIIIILLKTVQDNEKKSYMYKAFPGVWSHTVIGESMVCGIIYSTMAP